MCSKIRHFRLSVSTLSGDNILCVSREVPFWNKLVWMNQAAEWVVVIFTVQIQCPFCFGLVLSQSSRSLPVLLPLGRMVLPVYSSIINGFQGHALFSSSNVLSGSSLIHILVSFTSFSISWHCWLWQHKLSKDPLHSFSCVFMLQE
jgi:hypothetical protein